MPVGGLELSEGLDLVNSIAYGSSKQYQSVRPQDTLNVDASYFRGNHEFKFGYAYRRASTNSSSLLPGNGIEARIETARGKIARIQRELVSSFKGSYNALYLQDTFTKDRLTLQGGVRWDLQKAENAASTAPANPLFPEILPDLVYDGAGTKIEWSDISPRVGFTYALNESRKTLLRGNFSIFTQQLAHPDVTVINPIGGVARVDYRWNDLNNDNLINDRNEVDIAGGSLGAPVNAELTHGQRDRRGLQGAARPRGAHRDRPRAGAELRRERHLHLSPRHERAVHVLHRREQQRLGGVRFRERERLHGALPRPRPAERGGRRRGGLRPAPFATARTTTAPIAASS